jgi:Fe-S oxidoreductase
VLFTDTFNRWFEPENPRAARRVLDAAGYRVIESTEPLCCGRTFLAAGLVEEARAEAAKLLAFLLPHAERGTPVIGLEPSCLLTLRDEYLALMPGADTRAVAAKAVLFEEFLAAEKRAGTLTLPLKPVASEAHLHGHCHQKAFGVMGDVAEALSLIPGLTVKPIESSCCGMAGSFGYEAKHQEVSRRMAEDTLLPAVRSAPAGALIVADGTSCRHQIEIGAGRGALHVARVLERALA